jgi:glucokinase
MKELKWLQKIISSTCVFIGGGISPKILPALQSENFIRAFTAKGRFQSLLSDLSIKLSMNPNTPLIGAANYFL